MARTKDVENMTLEEAWRALEERAICGSCHKCFAGSSFWNEACGDVSKHAFYMIRDTFNGIESAYKESVMKESIMTDKEEESSIEPFYKQTTEFMKKSGYKKCYMCGSQLE